jgi:hypothetical protein
MLSREPALCTLAVLVDGLPEGAVLMAIHTVDHHQSVDKFGL